MYAVLRHGQLVTLTLNARRDEKYIHSSLDDWARLRFCPPYLGRPKIRPPPKLALLLLLLLFLISRRSWPRQSLRRTRHPKYRGIGNGRANDEEEGQGDRTSPVHKEEETTAEVAIAVAVTVTRVPLEIRGGTRRCSSSRSRSLPPSPSQYHLGCR